MRHENLRFFVVSLVLGCTGTGRFAEARSIGNLLYRLEDFEGWDNQEENYNNALAEWTKKSNNYETYIRRQTDWNAMHAKFVEQGNLWESGAHPILMDTEYKSDESSYTYDGLLIIKYLTPEPDDPS